MMGDDIASVLQTLPAWERRVLELRFGLSDGQPRTLEEVGREFGVARAGAAIALFGTGLIAAAAFVVGARRQRRLLGLIGAQGGEPRHIRATVRFGRPRPPLFLMAVANGW